MKRILASLLTCAAIVPPVLADRIALKDGRRFEGRLVQETPDELSLEVTILGQTVVMTVSRVDLASHDRVASPAEQYEERAGRVAAGDATAIAVIRFGTRYAVSGPPKVDEKTDLARLQVPVKGVTCLVVSGRKPQVGEKVYAIGSPLGVFTNTISDGMVSGIRPRNLDDYVIQTTAPISPGCSGGPLLDASGRVIGVNTATVEGGQNLNYAVSAAALNALLGRGR